MVSKNFRLYDFGNFGNQILLPLFLKNKLVFLLYIEYKLFQLLKYLLCLLIEYYCGGFTL